MAEETKTCPYCAETIKVEAIVCKHCGRELMPIKSPATLVPESPSPLAKKSGRGTAWLIILGLLLFICMGIYVIGSSSGGGSAPAQSASKQAPVPAKDVCNSRTWNGGGDDMVDVGDQSNCTKVTLTHSGSKNFIVVPYDANNQRLMSYVNDIGKYKGVSRWNPETRSVEIEADGKWTMAVE